MPLQIDYERPQYGKWLGPCNGTAQLSKTELFSTPPKQESTTSWCKKPEATPKADTPVSFLNNDCNTCLKKLTSRVEEGPPAARDYLHNTKVYRPRRRPLDAGYRATYEAPYEALDQPSHR